MVIVTEHSDMLDDLDRLDLREMKVEVVVDGRNCLQQDAMQESGILYRGIGRKA